MAISGEYGAQISVPRAKPRSVYSFFNRSQTFTATAQENKTMVLKRGSDTGKLRSLSYRAKTFICRLGLGRCISDNETKALKNVEENSPASTITTIKTFQSEVYPQQSTRARQGTQEQLESYSNIEDEVVRQSSTYDSLNLDDLILETNEDDLFSFESARMRYIREDPPPTTFLFRPVINEERRESSVEFGVDPEFIKLQATFAPRRNRAIDLMAI